MMRTGRNRMMMAPILAPMLAVAGGTAGATPAAAAVRDATAVALDRCLADPAHAATGDQTDCSAVAERAYDRRMNTAYATLMRRLPPPAADRLRRSQRAWLAYRDAEAATRQAIYATRQGTMFVPMESDDAVTVVADRARLLERYVRTLDIG